jgi:hypothetical protein
LPPPEYNIGARSGAQCANTAQIYCTSHECSIINYPNYKHDAHDVWTWRTDYFAD